MQQIRIEEFVDIRVLCGYFCKYKVALDLGLNFLYKLLFYSSGFVALRIGG